MGKWGGKYIGVGLFPANTFVHSGGDLRSRSTLEHITGAHVAPSIPLSGTESPLLAYCVGWLRNSCLRKRPSFLVSRRFAQENPTLCSNDLSG
jgi:hypothetical protein